MISSRLKSVISGDKVGAKAPIFKDVVPRPSGCKHTFGKKLNIHARTLNAHARNINLS